MFASKTPRDLSHDPVPWVYSDGSRTNYPEPWEMNLTFNPRPEFDHVQHNPPNRLLTLWRSGLDPYELSLWRDSRADTYDRAEWEHFDRVLDRYARLER